MTRAERVDRYREKKARRTDGGAVRYIARQQNAHRCGKESENTAPVRRFTAIPVCCSLHTVIDVAALSQRQILVQPSAAPLQTASHQGPLRESRGAGRVPCIKSRGTLLARPFCMLS